jgi:Sulfotransferase family
MNQPIVITGTQRSGTTLLSLILDSHPEVNAVDELDFFEESLPAYLSAPKLAPRVVFKLPQRATDPAWLRRLAGPRVLWCVRDPRDVAASMLELRIPLRRTLSVSWAIHPMGAPEDIARARRQLDDEQRAELAEELGRYDEVMARSVVEISFADAVLCASLAWRLMNEMLGSFDGAAQPHLVRYEELVTAPRTGLVPILEHLGLPWHDDLLRHHELHAGTHAAGTDGARPIDAASIGRWRRSLGEVELAVVERITRPLAERLGCWRGEAGAHGCGLM